MKKNPFKNQAEKITYLNGHLRYELLMLRYCLKRMEGAQKQLEYNMAYDAFMVHARILYWFLNNEDKNVQAQHFNPGFSSKKTPLTIKLYPKLLAQVMHLDDERPSIGDDKIQLKHVQDLAAWLQKEFQRFLDSLDQDLQDAWTPDDADPDKVEPDVLSVGPKGPQNGVISWTGPSKPTATNTPSSTSSKFTASSASTADTSTSGADPSKVEDQG